MINNHKLYAKNPKGFVSQQRLLSYQVKYCKSVISRNVIYEAKYKYPLLRYKIFKRISNISDHLHGSQMNAFVIKGPYCLKSNKSNDFVRFALF